MNITAVEMISLVSDYNVFGIAPLDALKNITIALQNAEDYNWDISFGEQGTLAAQMNLRAYMRQKGFDRNLSYAANAYKEFISKNSGSEFKNSDKHAQRIAASHGLSNIEIELRAN